MVSKGLKIKLIIFFLIFRKHGGIGTQFAFLTKKGIQKKSQTFSLGCQVATKDIKFPKNPKMMIARRLPVDNHSGTKLKDQSSVIAWHSDWELCI